MFERLMEERRAVDDAEGCKSVRRGWCLGDEAFRQELLEQMEGRVGEHHFGPERQQSVQEKAEEIVREEMRKAGWRERDLEQMPKGDAGKVAMARRVREETTVTSKWIASRLRMGRWTYLNNRLYWERRGRRRIGET